VRSLGDRGGIGDDLLDARTVAEGEGRIVRADRDEENLTVVAARGDPIARLGEPEITDGSAVLSDDLGGRGVERLRAEVYAENLAIRRAEEGLPVGREREAADRGLSDR